MKDEAELCVGKARIGKWFEGESRRQESVWCRW